MTLRLMLPTLGMEEQGMESDYFKREEGAGCPNRLTAKMHSGAEEVDVHADLIWTSSPSNGMAPPDGAR